MTLGASEIELTLAAVERFPAGVEERLRSLVDHDLDGQPTRLPRDVGGQREQVPAFGRKRHRLLPVGAADVDALLEIDRPPARDVEGRVARRDALHARAGVAMAVGARAAGGAALPVPQRRAVEDPEHARIDGVVILHRARLAADELVAGAALRERNLGSDGEPEEDADDRRQPRAATGAHATVIVAVSVTA